MDVKRPENAAILLSTRPLARPAFYAIIASNTLAITLPWIELLAALALLVGYRTRAGAIITASLMGLFVFVVAAALARGLDIECGCFGTADASRVGTAKLQRDGMFGGVMAQQPGAWPVDDRRCRHHLGIEQRATAHQPVEIAAMPVGPFHHRGDGKPGGQAVW